jgi:hypothetical protein
MHNRKLSRKIYESLLSGACEELANFCEYGGMTVFTAEFPVYSGLFNFKFSVFFTYSEPMSAKDPEGIFIPSVFVGEDAGLILKANYQYKSNCFVVINDELPFNINIHLLLPFAIVVGICFLILLVFVVSIQSIIIYVIW